MRYRAGYRWRQVCRQSALSGGGRLARAAGNKERDEEKEAAAAAAVVAQGDELLRKGEIAEKQTQPPRPFTDATLLSAMTGIARFVQDKI